MPKKFIIGSQYKLKDLPKCYYMGDLAGVLCFRDPVTGTTYEFLSDAELAQPEPKTEPVVQPTKAKK